MQDQNPFWQYLPDERRTRREQLALRARRLVSHFQRRRERVILVTTIYVVIWLLPLILGQALITVFALLPLLLVPPLGLLMYWLIWQEFHG